MADEPRFPAAADDDSEDVRWALETANAMWGRGEARDALRWLRRAAETASEEDDDVRSVMLAAAAADLRSHLDERGIPHTELPPPPEEDDDDEIMIEESIPGTPPSSPPESGDEEDDPPTQRTAPPEAPETAATPAPAPAVSRAVPKVPRPPKTPKESRSGRRLPRPPGRSSSRAAPSPRREGAGPPAVHAALRVAVTPGDRPGTFQVTALGPDEHALEGSTEALLVPLDPDTAYGP